MKKSTTAMGGLALVILGVGLYLYQSSRPSDTDCAFTGWQRTLGVELNAQLQDIDVVKTKLGISDSQVREFDNLRKDFALKYDAACQDARAQPPRMSQDEYTCVRRNMDRALDDIRRFAEAAAAAKTLTDAGAQKDVVLAALNNLRAADNAGYRANCASAMAVDPKNMAFHGVIPERSVEVTNRGNNDFTFAIEDYPSGFEPKPTAGRLAKGQSMRVSIFRTLLPVTSARPLSFHVRSNFNDDVTIQIDIDQQNADVWNALGDKLPAASPAGPTVNDALQVINAALPESARISNADKHILAANALFARKADAQAEMALRVAAKANGPAVETQPSVLMLRGLIASRGKTLDAGEKYFHEIDRRRPNNAAYQIYTVERIRGAARAHAVIR